MGALLLVNLIRFILIGLEVMVFARVILSFTDPGGRGQIARFVMSTTEPILAPIRRLLPRTGMLDFSPWIAVFAIGLLLRVLV